MGEQIANTTSGDLFYVPRGEFKKLLDSKIEKISKAQIFSYFCRINALYMIAKAGSGHIGSSFSSLEIMSWIRLNEDKEKTLFFSSKGHDAPALYATLLGSGDLNFDLIHTLRRKDGLPGHPDIQTPNVVTNTGSLGMGVSKAKGLVKANRLKGSSLNIIVLLGDGELQEGQLWESLISATNEKMDEITVIVDHNKIQSDTLLKNTSDLGSLEAKFEAFGWKVFRCDGNNVMDFAACLEEAKSVKGQPQVIIADTIKGKGVSFMEHTAIDSDVDFYKFHSGAPSSDLYYQALDELVEKTNQLLKASALSELKLELVNRPASEALPQQERLIQTYSKSLLEWAAKETRVVALDADLILDTGLIPFKEQFPDRFIECGIAEQDMVSQAGGLALAGMLPIVHSFSCFLSTRPNEQIYNNSTEKKKIIYVGSLAGVLPGGPGHSHQAIRDIASLTGVPNLVMVEPANSFELEQILEWAIATTDKSVYLRLVSVPFVANFKFPSNYQLTLGKGSTLVEGNHATLISYGPIMINIAVEVAKNIKQTTGIALKVINLPWLNLVDLAWLANEIDSAKPVFTIDNHYLDGGQGEYIAAALNSAHEFHSEVFRFGVTDIPISGTNDEVLEMCGLNSQAIEAKIKNILKI